MARTALLRFIEKLAREHQAADRLAIAPAEWRERQAELALTRRRFLLTAGGTAAAVALPKISPAAAKTARIAIVGGGIAGLNSALTLQDKGLAATVYEAASSIGGRMKTERSGYWSNKQISEMYGELIDTSHTTIRTLAKRFGLPLTDLLAAEPAGSTDTYYFLGRRFTKAEIDAAFVPVFDAAKKDLTAAGYPTQYNNYKPAGYALDHISVRRWIETRVPGGLSSAMGRLLDVAYVEEYGADSTDQSSLNLLYLLAYQPNPQSFAVFGVSDEKYHIEGGNQRLPEAIAAALPDVRLGWKMTALARNSDDTASLFFDAPGGKQTVTADHVILALPFAVLRRLDISRAGFDALKLKAINELGAGRNTKLLLQFTDRLWNRSGPWGLSNGSAYADLGFQNTWDTTRGQPGATGIIVNYTGGSTAAAFRQSTPYSTAAKNRQVSNYASAFLQQFETVFPGITSRWNGKATLSTPQIDPNLSCSYSYFRVGQYTAFSGYEGVAQGPIHFAGEHCSRDFQGYMEGGASEGARAGLEVFHAVK